MRLDAEGAIERSGEAVRICRLEGASNAQAGNVRVGYQQLALIVALIQRRRLEFSP
jgi:hypothetical protein